MADIPISLTCADYARVMPLATGDVKPEGVALTLIHGTGGSWEMRAEMLRRALDDPAVQGGEASMAGHLRRIDKGDRSHVGLPVFPLRNFTARDLYVRKGGPVKTPADLTGKRIGMYDWVASGSIWYRHFLQFIDVPPASSRRSTARPGHSITIRSTGRSSASFRISVRSSATISGRPAASRHSISSSCAAMSGNAIIGSRAA